MTDPSIPPQAAPPPSALRTSPRPQFDARRRARWGLLVSALLMGVVLIAISALNYRNSHQLAVTVARGQGELLMASLRSDLRKLEHPYTDQMLEAVLEAHKDQGLSYLAYYHMPDTLKSSAGTSHFSSPTRQDMKGGSPALTYGIPSRLIAPLPPVGNGRDIPPHEARQVLAQDACPPHMTELECQRWLEEDALTRPERGFESGPPERFRDGPPDGRPGGPRGRRGDRPPPDEGPPPGERLSGGGLPPTKLLLEFNPSQAIGLTDNALQMLVISILSSLGLMFVAGIFWRLSVRSDQAEALLERQARLASLGEMSAVLAHELRNPLASLKGHAQLLEERLAPGTKERDKAARVVKEAVRIETLCSSLLDFVRSGQISRQEVDPSALLQDVVDGLAKHPVILHLEKAPPRVALDPVRMQQVLTNLLENARQASPPDAPIEASITTKDKGVVFTVRDHGTGIAPDTLSKIFEPFHTTKTRGVGLGLAVAQRIVELHRGRIQARNHPAGGAEFEVFLPAT